MSDIANVYGYDLTELLTNSDLKIDDNDKDFKHILMSLQRISDNLYIGMKNECEVFESTLTSMNRSSSHSRIDLNHLHLCANNRKGGYRNRFPMKLFQMLDESEASGHAHIISWLPDGNSFKIHDEKLFDQYVLAKYFKSSLQSFKRQLYMYGFKKVGKQLPDVGAYFQQDFIRGEKELCSTMRNWRIKASDYRIEDVNFSEIPRALKNANKCLKAGCEYN